MSDKYKASGNDRSVVFHHIFIEDDRCRFVWNGGMFRFAAMEKQNAEIEKRKENDSSDMLSYPYLDFRIRRISDESKESEYFL